MSKIVVLSTIYLGAASANGICARNIVEQLRQLGHRVEVVCYEKSDYSEEYIHTVPQKNSPIRTGISKVLYKLSFGFQLALQIGEPVMDRNLAANYYKKLCQINAQGKIDAVVAMYFPTESLKAAYQFKKENPHVRIMTYELDSVGDGIATSTVYALENQRHKKFLSKVYLETDVVFVMAAHESYWRKAFGGKYDEKLVIVDIPVLSENTMVAQTHNEGVSMIYAGLIERKYRSPAYLLAVLKEMNKTLDITFDFYSKGDCEEDIAEAAKVVKGITLKGYVPQEELEKGIADSDILVSIGNSVSRSVPSKIITYISYGKPIIHFSSQTDDVCKEYFYKYPLSLVVDQSLPIVEACEEIKKFISNNKGKNVPYEIVKEIYYLNDPKYSASLIADVVDGLGHFALHSGEERGKK